MGALARRPGALVLDYEDLASRPGDAVAAVLRHIGVDAPADLPADASLRRQADALTEDWVRPPRGVTLTPPA